MAGDVTTNIGLFVAAILAHPSVSLPSKYALVTTKPITCENLIKAWGEVTGKDTAYIQVSPQAFDSLWPKFGAEIAAQLQWGESIGDWAKLETGLLSAKDLRIDEKEVVGLKAYLEGAKEQLI